MPSAKLIQILNTLSPKEFKKLETYMQSPFFNTNPRLITMVKLLRKATPDFEHPSLGKEALFRAMYGKEVAYNEQQVYDHISFLMRHLEDFLVQLDLEEDDYLKKIKLMRTLTNRGLNDHFSRTEKKVRRKLTKEGGRNSDYFLNEFNLNRESNYSFTKRYQRGFDNNLINMVQSLDAFYFITKLRYACEILSRSKIVNFSYELEMMPEIIACLQEDEHPFLQIPAIQIYLKIYLLLTEPEHESDHYQDLVNLLEQHCQEFEVSEGQTMITFAMNFCINKVNSGEGQYFQKIFQLYQLMIKNDVLLVDGKLNHQYFKNIVSVGLNLKEFEWIRKFMDDYHIYITEEKRETAYNYNLANYYYYQKEYRKALRTLQFLEIDDVYYHLSVKKLLLKTYYELEEEDSLESLVSTFYAYIKRNKTISKSNFEAYRNLLRFVRKADKLRQKQLLLDDETFAKQAKTLLTQIESAANLPDSWIRSKVSEMIREVEKKQA
jgi:hypothetical protein